MLATKFQYSGKQFYLPINEITYYNFDSSSLKDVMTDDVNKYFENNSISNLRDLFFDFDDAMIDDNHNEVVFKCIDFYSKADEFYVAVNFNDKCFYMIENNKRKIIG